MIACVYVNRRLAGYLEQSRSEHSFWYVREYLEAPDSTPISFSFPLRADRYTSINLFPFFAGLVSEGWLLGIQSQAQKIDERDYFRLLLENGDDVIGAVSLRPEIKT